MNALEHRERTAERQRPDPRVLGLPDAMAVVERAHCGRAVLEELLAESLPSRPSGGVAADRTSGPAGSRRSRRDLDDGEDVLWSVCARAVVDRLAHEAARAVANEALTTACTALGGSSRSDAAVEVEAWLARVARDLGAMSAEARAEGDACWADIEAASLSWERGGGSDGYSPGSAEPIGPPAIADQLWLADLMADAYRAAARRIAGRSGAWRDPYGWLWPAGRPRSLAAMP